MTSAQNGRGSSFGIPLFFELNARLIFLTYAPVWLRLSSGWFTHAQLLYLGFRRQRSPRLIINRGRNKDINALCLISNMSAESVFIEYIIAELETSASTITMDVTDFELEYLESGDSSDGQSDQAAGNQRPLNASENTRQGPIQPGGSGRACAVISDRPDETLHRWSWQE